MKSALILFTTTFLSTPYSLSFANKEKQNNDTQVHATTSQDSTLNNFIIEKIPFSKTELGDFPYFSLPDGFKTTNKPLIKKFDQCFFPIDGKMTPIEGQLWKANISSTVQGEFSQRYFEKSLENFITSELGGQLIFQGNITREEQNRYLPEDHNKGDEGDIGYYREKISVFLIRHPKEGNIYIQYSADNASGKLNILQEDAFEQTITKNDSESIIQDIFQNGKAILHIPFDLNQSTLTTEGQNNVNEIKQALDQHAQLKISIEGHTDDSGDLEHNQKLSLARAETVRKYLIVNGIEPSRLSVKGYGEERPLRPNDSEENKLKNRRVELVKTQ